MKLSRLKEWATAAQAPMARGVALFLGGFTVLNMIGEWRAPGFDANVWWLDVRFMPGGWAVLLLGAAGLLALGLALPWGDRLMRAARWAVGVLALVALWNTAGFYRVWRQGVIVPGMPVPLSLWLAAALGWIAWATHRRTGKNLPRWVRAGAYTASFGGALVIFPLAQMYCFGQTHYMQQAGAIVVFGAKVDRNGVLSQALYDRTLTGIALYQQGRAPLLVFSGGPGEGGAGAISEPMAMRRLALEKGVPEEAIVLDEAGLNTEATVANTAAFCRDRGIGSVVAVSHDYHLPRVKLTFARAGLEAYTAPARETQPLGSRPFFMAREVAALWVYYLRPLGRPASRELADSRTRPGG